MSNRTRSELRRAIETSLELLSSPDSEGALFVREIRSVSTEAGSVLVGVDASGRGHLLLAVDPASEKRAQPEGSSISAHRRDLRHGDDTHVFVDVVCLEPRLRRLFGLLCTDLLERLVQSPADPEAVVATTLDEWRELVAAARRPIDEARARGLFGELHQLLQLLEVDATAIECWRGPEASEHDLSRGGRAVEVKSLARRSSLVEIHGIRQLEPPADGQLALAVQAVETRSEGTSLGSIIALVERSCSDAGLFNDRLALMGLEASDPALDAFRFEVTDVRFYDVTEEFPRLVTQDLVRGHLHPAIRTLSYVLDISTAEEPMDEAAVQRFREAMVQS